MGLSAGRGGPVLMSSRGDERMTEREWDKTLQMAMHYPVEITCDGHVVKLIMGRISKTKATYGVFFAIDDRVIGKATSKPEELPDLERKLLCPCRKYNYHSALRSTWKNASKRERKRIQEATGIQNPMERITFYYPWWTSPEKLFRHLHHQFETVEAPWLHELPPREGN